MAALQFQDLAMAVDDALLKRLTEMTPPLDDQKELQETLEIEAESRGALEADGCPPCYPTEMDISKEPPTKYRQIVEYWKAFFGTDDVILYAQLEDWNKFRRIQARDRQSFAKCFDQFTANVRGRLKSHGVNEQFTLSLDPKDQAPRDTWIEFQHYQLRRLERMKKKRDDLQEKVGSAHDGSSPTTPGSDTVPNYAAMLNLESIQNKIEAHAILRQWIAEKLPTLSPGLTERDQPDVPRTRRASARAQQLKRQPTGGENKQSAYYAKEKGPKTTAPNITAPKKTANSAPRRTASAQVQLLKGQPAGDKNSTIPSMSKQTANTTRKRKASHLDTNVDVETSRPTKVRAAKGFSSPSASSSQQIKARSNAKQANSKSKGREAGPEATQSPVVTRIGRISRAPVRYTP